MKLFDKYQHSEANEEEQSIVTERLIQNKFNQELRQKMAQRLDQEYGIKRETGSARMRRLQLIRWGSGIAAAILVGLAIWQLSTPELDYQALTAEYLTEYVPTNERGKGLEDAFEQRAAAIDAYLVKDFERAAELRKLVTDSEYAEAEDFFYLGLSYLYQNPPQINAAVAALQEANRYTDSLVEEETQWFLSLAYLQAEQLHNARPLLQAIVTNRQWNAAKARKLLKRLPRQ